MIVYCDTSALIKRYVEEDGTAQVDSLWENADAVSTSVVAFAETMAALNRKFREGILSKNEFKETAREFKEDYEKLILVPMNKELNNVIEGLLRKHTLRGFDAIHLSSALVFAEASAGLVFACFDSALNVAAAREGLRLADQA